MTLSFDPPSLNLPGFRPDVIHLHRAVVYIFLELAFVLCGAKLEGE